MYILRILCLEHSERKYGANMRKLILVLCISGILSQLVGCGGKVSSATSTQQRMNTSTTAPIEQSKPIFDKEIKTKSYSISIPKDWTYKELETETLSFNKEDKEVGGLYIQPYYKDVADPVEGLLPNHSEITETKKLEGFFTETHEIKLTTSSPAASGDISTENWIYIFFIKDKTTIYEIFFNTKFIDEDSILKIAKSFKTL